MQTFQKPQTTMSRPGVTPAFIPQRAYTIQLKIRPPTTTSMSPSRSADSPTLQRHSKLSTATTTTHCCLAALNPRKSKRPGPLITPASSSSPPAQPSSSSKTAPSSSFAATYARAMALGLTTSSTRACVASSHTSVRYTATRCPRRPS